MNQSNISEDAYRFLRAYIEKECGIALGDNKQYLVETRLKDLVHDEGCSNFMELYIKANSEKTRRLRDRIVDAMTTNETLWFRDGGPFRVFREKILPQYAEEIREGKRRKIRIWSAASSTGQEAYSIVMSALEYMRTQTTIKPEHLEILGTDISQSALEMAGSARYSGIAVTRGLPPEYKSRYFKQDGRYWQLLDKVKNLVDFKFLNLQDSFGLIGKFDIVLVRYVAIYFSDEFKQELFGKVWHAVNPGGYLFLGSSETIDNYSSDFEVQRHGGDTYYQAKSERPRGSEQIGNQKIMELLSSINSRLDSSKS